MKLAQSLLALSLFATGFTSIANAAPKAPQASCVVQQSQRGETPTRFTIDLVIQRGDRMSTTYLGKHEVNGYVFEAGQISTSPEYFSRTLKITTRDGQLVANTELEAVAAPGAIAPALTLESQLIWNEGRKTTVHCSMGMN